MSVIPANFRHVAFAAKATEIHSSGGRNLLQQEDTP
jgi:hypothetical protein